MSKTQVAVKETKEYSVALGNVFEDDANNGFDNMGQEDFALPFLRLLTNTSPEVGEVEGALPGALSPCTTSPCLYIRF